MSVDVSKIKVGDTVTGSFEVHKISLSGKNFWSSPNNGYCSILHVDHITAHEPGKVPVQVGDKFKVYNTDKYYEEVVHIQENHAVSVYYCNDGTLNSTTRPLSFVQKSIEKYGNFKDT